MTAVQNVIFATFHSFHVRSYRLYFAGQLGAATAIWMQGVAQEWIVLELTSSPLAVGITAAFQFLPTLLFGMYGGLVADRVDKRRLLIWTRVSMAILSLMVVVLTLTGTINLAIMYAIALATGIVVMLDLPTRHAFVSEIVSKADLPNAVALNSAVVNVARIGGPALVGVTIALVGIPAAFGLTAMAYGVAVIAMLAIRPSSIDPHPRLERKRGQIRAGLAHVWSDIELRETFIVVALIAIFAWNFRIVLPLMARFEFNSGAATFGLLYAIMASGSLVGALVMARRQRATRTMLFTAATCFGVLMGVTALMPDFRSTALALVPLGFAGVAFMTTANARMQLLSKPEFRGRIMALFGIVFLGSIPLGGPLVGWLATVFGPRAGFVLGAAATLLTVGAASIWRWRRERTVNLSRSAFQDAGIDDPGTVSPRSTQPSEQTSSCRDMLRPTMRPVDTRVGHYGGRKSSWVFH